MSYKDRSILTDRDGNAIPQIWDEVMGDFRPVTTDDVQKVLVNPSAISQFRTGSLVTTTTAKEVKVGTSPLADRKQIMIYPPAEGVVYWGTISVTAATGAPINPGDKPLIFDVDRNSPNIYVVSDGTDREIRVVEAR